MKIICIGRNYANHAKELNNPVPTKPLVFMKPSSALLVNNKPLYYPEFTKDLHYEVEVVLKITRNGRHVQPEFAPKYYEEIAIGIDFTARDVQSQLKAKGHPWEIAKGFDGSAAISEFIPLSSLKDREHIEFSLFKQGIHYHNFISLANPDRVVLVYVARYKGIALQRRMTLYVA